MIYSCIDVIRNTCPTLYKKLNVRTKDYKLPKVIYIMFNFFRFNCNISMTKFIAILLEIDLSLVIYFALFIAKQTLPKRRIKGSFCFVFLKGNLLAKKKLYLKITKFYRSTHIFMIIILFPVP